MASPIMRVLVGGVPRAGKSILCRRLHQEWGPSHIPLDSLVSTLGHVFPEHGISHYGPRWEATAARFKPFLFEFLRHLEYEEFPVVVDGYHVLPRDVAQLDRTTYRTVFLGYPHLAAPDKVAAIRQRARPGDWTETLTEAELSAIVQRYIDQSAQLAAECARYDLPFVDTGGQFAQAIETAYRQVTHNA